MKLFVALVLPDAVISFSSILSVVAEPVAMQPLWPPLVLITLWQ